MFPVTVQLSAFRCIAFSYDIMGMGLYENSYALSYEFIKDGTSYGSRTSGSARVMMQVVNQEIAGITLLISESVSIRNDFDSFVRLFHPSNTDKLSYGNLGDWI